MMNNLTRRPAAGSESSRAVHVNCGARIYIAAFKARYPAMDEENCHKLRFRNGAWKDARAVRSPGALPSLIQKAMRTETKGM
jgi:hypothetical protein